MLKPNHFYRYVGTNVPNTHIGTNISNEPIDLLTINMLYNHNNNFTIGNIYQAINENTIHDKFGGAYCVNNEDDFEEVDIGLDDSLKSFFDTLSNKPFLKVYMTFFNSTIGISMTVTNSVWVTRITNTNNLNQDLRKMFKKLREQHIKTKLARNKEKTEGFYAKFYRDL